MLTLLLTLLSDPTAQVERLCWSHNVIVVDYHGNGLVMSFRDASPCEPPIPMVGFQGGDRVLAVGGTRYVSSEWWSRVWQHYRPGAVVEVLVWRKGYFLPVVVSVTLKARP